MGMLAGIEDATGFDLRECEHFVGTSAGSIVSARLAAGQSPRRPTTRSTELEPVPVRQVGDGMATAALQVARRASEWTLAATAPVAPLMLAASGPGGALMRAGVLTRIRTPDRTLDDLRDHVDRYDARFDGRLRVAAVDRARGRRVMFGSPGSPRAGVGEAVAASCSVPWLFAPVTIAGE